MPAVGFIFFLQVGLRTILHRSQAAVDTSTVPRVGHRVAEPYLLAWWSGPSGRRWDPLVRSVDSSSALSSMMSSIYGWQFYPWVWVPTDIVPAWVGYGHTFMPMGSTHTLPIKSWVWHRYSLLPAGIPIPYPFILPCGSTVS
jgi:hypothetical protein